MTIISGSSHPALAKDITQKGRFSLGLVELTRLPNGEARPRILTDIKGEDIAIVQTLSDPVDMHIIELLLLIDAARRMKAKTITVLLPWMGYSLQNKVFRKGEPLSAEVIARTIGNAGVDRVITLDLHAPEICTMFGIPTIKLSALPLFAELLRREQNILIVGPDSGSAKRAQQLSSMLGVRSICLRKERSLETGAIHVSSDDMDVSGAHGAHCVLLDDVIVTGSTLVHASQLLKANGASNITVCATHGLFVGDAVDALKQAPIDRIIVTDSIPSRDDLSNLSVEAVTVAGLFAEALHLTSSLS
ncbi:MAG: ribose-phosphate pyrophosphokinase [bacterium]|nr:ribose-phosphate pyrophosphokinase [bacterium]